MANDTMLNQPHFTGHVVFCFDPVPSSVPTVLPPVSLQAHDEHEGHESRTQAFCVPVAAGYAWEGGGTRLGVDDAIFIKFKFVACSIAFACVSLPVP